MNGLQSGLLVALTVALVSVEGCGKSATEIAAEKAADEASSRAAAEKAQVELDADSKKFREIATSPPKPPPTTSAASELLRCLKTGSCNGTGYCVLIRYMTVQEVQEILGEPWHEQSVGFDHYRYFTVPTGNEYGATGRSEIQVIGRSRVTGCNYY